MTLKSSLILIIYFYSSFALHAQSTSSNILLFGDFGTGLPDQRLVADDMVNFCRAKTCDFAVVTGDNIYPHGVVNLKDGIIDYDNGSPNYQIVTDYFVKVYGALKMPFYMSFGNHDVGNEGVISIFKDLFKSSASIKKRTIALMRNEINYTFFRDNPVIVDALGRSSHMWFFPDEYYYQLEKGNVHLVALNTNSFPHRALNATNDEINAVEKNFAQQAFLSSTLKNKIGWKIVYGHMPLYTRGRHAALSTSAIGEFRSSIIHTLCEERVDFYVSGHDHHLQVDKHQCANGHVLISVVTGAAAKRDRIYQKAFRIFSQDTTMLWGNGRDFFQDKSVFHEDDFALGFAHLQIIDPNNAKLTMRLSLKNTLTQMDGCFGIVKGTSIAKTKCD